MVFKYAFDMLFDIGLERNKAETIKFIQAIIDEGYFNRQELYKERSRKMDMSFAYNLNLARKRCGFTQTDMSKKIAYWPNNIYEVGNSKIRTEHW